MILHIRASTLRRCTWIVLACGLAVVSACSPDDGDATLANTTVEARTLSDEEAAIYFLRNYLGPIDYSEVTDFEAYRVTIIESFVAQCMDVRGFPYAPLAVENYAPEQPGSILTPEQYAETYGFGITTGLTPPPLPPDPNDEIVSGLGDAEANAFYAARLECGQEANEQFISRMDLPDSLQLALDTLQADVASDGQLLKAQGGYEACMKAQGYVATSPADARQSVRTQLSESSTVDPGEALVAFEIGIAKADFACGSSYWQTYRDVRDRELAEFFELNGTELIGQILGSS